MTMDNTEIINAYRAAKDPKKQIDVLAELNACTREDIIKILTDGGAKVDRRWFTNPRKTQQAKLQKPQGDESEQTPDPEAQTTGKQTGKGLVLTKVELLALREYMEETLADYIHAKTECDNINMAKVHALTGVWLRLIGGRV